MFSAVHKIVGTDRSTLTPEILGDIVVARSLLKNKYELSTCHYINKRLLSARLLYVIGDSENSIHDSDKNDYYYF